MKKQKIIKNVFSAVLTAVLIAALVLSAIGCEKTPTDSNSSSQAISSEGTASSVDIGKGQKQFIFTVETDNEKKVYNVKTDKTTVGEALLELELISGDVGDYGLYVKKVDGISADYETDKAYWAFYVNNKYANSGVDKTDIKEGENYTFKKEKS